MKKILWIFLLVLIPILVTAQTSNTYWRADTAVTSKTLYTNGTSSVVGGWLDRISFGVCVASDTVIIRNGVDTVANIILGSTAPAPFTIQYGCRLDTSLIIIKKKTSDITVIYGKT
ncbi:MAG: hypothetical protein IMZ53_04945, partial [Thermoplasmata archaeon]|nr:hypothetical protein [Thermoplasmata archaeon]